MSQFATLSMIMLFYAILTFVLLPGLGYLIMKKDGITYGMVIGGFLSIVLWLQYGKKMV